MTFEQALGSTGALVPFERGELWGLTLGGWTLEVDPVRGARICTLSLNGRNLLTGPDIDPENYGSTFWTSPQSDWEWPPVPEVDSSPYAVVDCETSFLCAGGLSAKLGILVTKRFSAVPGRDAARIDYTMSNQSSETLRFAPWEISRVPGGLTFFESGGGSPPEPRLPVPEILESGGITWYEYDRDKVKQDQKLLAHSHGTWMAHVVGDCVLIKEFERVPFEKQAPGEAVIEVFASGSKNYIEIEQQGAHAKIGPWKSNTWTVNWLPRTLPDDIEPVAGNPQLVDWVRRQLA